MLFLLTRINMRASCLGVAASGSREVSQTAVDILEAGGNAFDAALAALCTATVAEPLLASLGGGGFLVAMPASGEPVVYDFFCQTPAKRRPEREIDFYPIMADFGAAMQEFHIGLGSMAVPGVVGGIFEIHRDLGRMPVGEIMAPAIDLARSGVEVNAFFHYIVRILQPIVESSRESFCLYESPGSPSELIREGEKLVNPGAADTLDLLAMAGPDIFYRGDWAEQLARDCRDGGGQLTLADLAAYRVERRAPVRFNYRDAECFINPPPSPGGCLLAFALNLLADWLPAATKFGSREHILNLLRSMRAASLARNEYKLELGLDHAKMEQLLDSETMRRWKQSVQLHSMFSRGTTHISVADAQGNLASLTVSNGEGCSYVLPGTGVMRNNMLGEEDLNPGGFHRWKEGCRLASMMSPAVVERADGTRLALGSGGSNRIRSAISQVLINHLDFQMTLKDAVAAPRIHLESEMLSIEEGFSQIAMQAMEEAAPEIHEWARKNLFFGGVHAVSASPEGHFDGAGDPRRGGEVAFASQL
jgi:gamma-glutamyltranspeptidase/glutathione hydrolase